LNSSSFLLRIASHCHLKLVSTVGSKHHSHVWCSDNYARQLSSLKSHSPRIGRFLSATNTQHSTESFSAHLPSNLWLNYTRFPKPKHNAGGISSAIYISCVALPFIKPSNPLLATSGLKYQLSRNHGFLDPSVTTWSLWGTSGTEFNSNRPDVRSSCFTDSRGLVHYDQLL
jgi:hypothetical protein